MAAATGATAVAAGLGIEVGATAGACATFAGFADSDAFELSTALPAGFAEATVADVWIVPLLPDPDVGAAAELHATNVKVVSATADTPAASM